MILGRGKPRPLEGEGTFPSIISQDKEGKRYCVYSQHSKQHIKGWVLGTGHVQEDTMEVTVGL